MSNFKNIYNNENFYDKKNPKNPKWVEGSVEDFFQLSDMEIQQFEFKQAKEYIDATIGNIKINEKHPGIVYASVFSRNGKLLISSTLDYCCLIIKEYLTIISNSKNER